MKNQRQGIGTLYLAVICIAIITVIMFLNDHSILNIVLGALLCIGLLYFGSGHYKKAEGGTESFAGTCIAIIYSPLLLTWAYTLRGNGKTIKVKSRERLHVKKGLDYKFELCKDALDDYKTGKPVVINEFYGYEERDESDKGKKAKFD